jgi:hypothetical protein
MTKLKNLFRSPYFRLTLIVFVVIVLSAVLFAVIRVRALRARFERIDNWMANPAAYPQWQVEGGTRCGNAPMLIPTTAFIGVNWNDGLPPLYQHTGYDMFSPDGADNVTPIYAVYDGYLTREDDWRSAVIIRHPDFTELPDITNSEQIWTYYTHMASRDGSETFISPDFPRGTREKFVEAGTLLGYQGSWSGSNSFELNRHLHLSIVKSDENGHYTNETRIRNTFDPAPFLGLTPNEDGVLVCGS